MHQRKLGAIPWLTGATMLVAVIVLAISEAGASQPMERSGCPVKEPLGGQGATLTVHHMSCGKARKIVLAFHRVSQSEGSHATVHGFDCHAKSGSGFPIVKCRRGDKRLRYEGGFYKARSRRGTGKPSVACAAGGELHFKVAPRECLILKRGCPGTSACYIALERMKWAWGDGRAKGHGKRGFTMAGLFPVRVRLTKPVTRCGRTVFSKISVHGEAPDGSHYRDQAHVLTCPSQFP